MTKTTILTNTQTAGRPGQPQNAIGLPDGRVLEAGASLPYPNWDKIKDRPVMQHYVDSGLIKVSKGEPEETEEAKAAREAAEAQALAAQQAAEEQARLAQEQAAAAEAQAKAAQEAAAAAVAPAPKPANTRR